MNFMHYFKITMMNIVSVYKKRHILFSFGTIRKVNNKATSETCLHALLCDQLQLYNVHINTHNIM